MGTFAKGEVVQGFALRRVPFEGAKRNQKPMGAQCPQSPRGGRKEKFAQPKSGKLALHGSGVAFVVFVIVWWLDRLSFIDCSDSAAFLTAEQIFLKAWKARAFSFTPTYWGEPKRAIQLSLHRSAQNHQL